MLTLGPLYRGRIGFGRYLKSLWSRFSSKGTEDSSSKYTERLDLSGTGDRHTWRVLSGSHERNGSSDAIKYHVDWELTNVRSSEGTQKSHLEGV